MSNDTSKPALSDLDLSRAELARRLDAQREKLYHALGVIECVIAAMKPHDWPANQPGCPFALMAAKEIIDNAAGALEAEVILETGGDP
jgi:hypothetical protein